MLWDFSGAQHHGPERPCAGIHASDICADAIETIASPIRSRHGRAHQIDAASARMGSEPPRQHGPSVLRQHRICSAKSTSFTCGCGAHAEDTLARPVQHGARAEGPGADRITRDVSTATKRRQSSTFKSGFRKAFTALSRDKMDPRFPLTVYYAFKQDDEEAGPRRQDDGSAAIDLTTGWETLLEALISSGFQITATWPVRASQVGESARWAPTRWRPTSSWRADRALASAPQIAASPFRQELKRHLPSCPPAPAAGQHRAGRLCAGRDWSWHGRLLPLRPNP